MEAAELLDDIEDRVLTIEEKLDPHNDPVDEYRGRSYVNQRLRHFLDYVTLKPDGGIDFQMKPGFENIDADMLAIYGPQQMEDLDLQ